MMVSSSLAVVLAALETNLVVDLSLTENGQYLSVPVNVFDGTHLGAVYPCIPHGFRRRFGTCWQSRGRDVFICLVD
jgi:hypothetical protein